MTLILTHSDVARLIQRDEVRDAVEQAHTDLAHGTALAPAPVALNTPDGGSFLPMTALSGTLAGVKMLADLPDNAAKRLPVQRSSIMLNSADTGECVAIIDGRLITAIRTAAASAVATRHLARPDSTVLGLIGAGSLAVEHTRAVAAVRTIDTVVVWSRSPETLDRYRAAVADLDLDVRTPGTVEKVIQEADIVCTLTPSHTPIVHGEWFHDGLHVNAVGAPPRPGHREIDGAGMARARIVLDSRDTALTKSGEVLLAIAEGHLTTADLDTELGDVITGKKPGRTSADQITLFNSVGLGLQDVATARLLLEHAHRTGAGTTVDLSS